MTKFPLFSIITVSYNSSATIRTTFQSILKQNYDSLEYIIIDGCSTDSTVSIIKRYEKKFEEKGIIFRWVSEPDNGIYDAMNKGISMATGDYVGIINSDDWYESNIIGKIAKIFINNQELDMVYGNINLYKNNKFLFSMKSKKNFNSINKKMCIWHPTVFIKKQVYKNYGVFDTRFRVCADWDFMLRINKRIIFKYVSMVIANMRMEGVSNRPDNKTYLEAHKLKHLHNSYFVFDFHSYFKIFLLNIFGVKHTENYYLFRKKVKVFILKIFHKY